MGVAGNPSAGGRGRIVKRNVGRKSLQQLLKNFWLAISRGMSLLLNINFLLNSFLMAGRGKSFPGMYADAAH